ncbi:MAG: cytidylate kinase-like family protein [Salinivirgaceae bacterium]|nr:cytidylate kinase-like family protein [Salinivirgaceae bacterium]
MSTYLLNYIGLILFLKWRFVMENILFKYFENRYQEAKNQLNLPSKFGPVITISRQSGCEAKKIAKQLVFQLNEQTENKPWKFIDKEILEKSAKELNLSTSKIEHFYKGKEKSSIIDMFVAFSKSHVNDLKIKNTIKEVMISLCREGHIVFIGRAGAAILQEKPNVCNIRLTAPFYWRISTIMKNQNTSIEEAEEWAIETDENRYKLFYMFLEKQPRNLEYLFDATINRQSYGVNQTTDLIIKLAKMKGLKF